MLANRSIRIRILVILGGLAAGYLLLLAMVQITAGATHRHMERISTSLFPASNALNDTEASFGRMKKEYKDAVVLEAPEALRDADKESEAVRAALAALQSRLASSPQFAPQVNALQQQFQSISSQSHDTYATLLGSRENVSDALEQKVSTLAHQNNDFSAAMDALASSLAATSSSEFSAVDAASIRTSVTGRIVLFIALLGCAGGWWVLHYRVLLPLSHLSRRLQDIAEGDGDLTSRVDVHGNNEIDEVGRWFNIFIERMERIVASVMHNGLALGQAAGSLAQVARETATQSRLQQEQAKRITSSMGEISTASHEISATTKTAAEDARKAEGNAHAGGETIQSTVTIIQQLMEANQATATKIEELGKSSDAIGKIIQVIDDIAEQTNLLALNANIEAARAGEHGRGFAVVAMEVRRLAERTGHATREIDQTVRAIQQGTAEAVEAMRSNMNHVQIGVTSAQSAGEVLESIIRGSESLQVMVTQIANASNEQSYATHSVNGNISEIVSIGERTIQSSADAVEACDKLTLLAADLNELVRSFKVRSEIQPGAKLQRPAKSSPRHVMHPA